MNERGGWEEGEKKEKREGERKGGYKFSAMLIKNVGWLVNPCGRFLNQLSDVGREGEIVHLFNLYIRGYFKIPELLA